MQTVVVILFCFWKPVKNEHCMILFLLEIDIFESVVQRFFMLI